MVVVELFRICLSTKWCVGKSFNILATLFGSCFDAVCGVGGGDGGYSVTPNIDRRAF
jgi:hypothetical protein